MSHDAQLRDHIAGLNQDLVRFEKQVDSLRAEVARLTAELQARTEERDAIRSEHRRIIGNVAKALMPASPKGSREAEFTLDGMGACQIIRRMREERDGLIRKMEQSRESGCWCDEHGHPCKGCEWKQERDGLAVALESIAKQGYLSHATSSADAIKVSDGMVDVAKAALRPSDSCTHQEQMSGLVAAIEPFRKYIELRYAIFSEHALDSIPTLQVSHTGRFGTSTAEITKADWDRIRYALVPGVGVTAILSARDARAKAEGRAEGLAKAATYMASEFPLNDVAYRALRRMAERDLAAPAEGAPKGQASGRN